MGFIKNLMAAYRGVKSLGNATGFNAWLLGDDKDATSQFRSTKDYLSAAQMISWVSICCSIIGSKVAMTFGDIYTLDGEPAGNKDLAKLFKRPNPATSGYAFKEMLVWHLLLSGNAYILKWKASAYDRTSSGKFSEMYIINPALFSDFEMQGNAVVGYTFRTIEGANMKIPASDIVHIKLPNPLDDRSGLGKIQANEMVYNTEWAAQTYNWRFFANGGYPEVVLFTSDKVDPEEQKRIESKFSEKYQGYQRSHKVPLLQGGIDIKNIGLSQKDMAFVEQRKFTREEILGIFGVPPAKAGIYEYANYANSKEQDATFLAECIAPLLVRIQDAFTYGIIASFDNTLEYCFDNVIRIDRELNMKLAAQAIANGLMTPNEARQEYLDINPVEGNDALDSYYMDVRLMPVGAEPTTPAAPVPEKGITIVSGKREFHRKANRLQQRILAVAVRTKKGAHKPIKTAITKFFKAQKEDVLSKLDQIKGLPGESFKGVDDVFDGAEQDKLIKKAMSGVHTSVVMKAVNDVNDVLGTETDNSTTNPAIAARIGRLASKVTVINETTRADLDKTLREGLGAGESVPQLKARVEAVYEGAEGYRAEMIARTEAFRAWDGGAIECYKDFGAEFVDVIGCECNEAPCNQTGIPIDEADGLDFHPNHTGTIVPAVS